MWPIFNLIDLSKVELKQHPQRGEWFAKLSPIRLSDFQGVQAFRVRKSTLSPSAERVKLTLRSSACVVRSNV